MVAKLIEHDNLDLDTTTKHYDSETGAWNGQLAVPGMPPATAPVERKTGGAAGPGRMAAKQRGPGGPCGL